MGQVAVKSINFSFVLCSGRRVLLKKGVATNRIIQTCCYAIKCIRVRRAMEQKCKKENHIHRMEFDWGCIMIRFNLKTSTNMCLYICMI